MIFVVLIAAAGAILLLALVTVGLVELYRDVATLREAIGQIDQSKVLPLAEATGTLASAHGLPDELDTWAEGTVLFLADICGTCAAITVELAPAPPPFVFVCLSARSEEGARAWFAASGFAEPPDTMIFDANDHISNSLGIHTAPSMVTLRGGRIVSARTVPSVRWLRRLVLSPPAARHHQPH